MNFERSNLQSVEETPEKEEFKERLSVDYQNIRKEAVAILDQKIKLTQDELGSNIPEIAAYESAKERLGDDQYIINLAKVNNWEKSRKQTEDLEEEDKKLAQGLVMSVLSLH